MSFVLDSSVTLAWVYPEETTDPVRELVSHISTGAAWVPSLWYLEVANVLQGGVRRGRTDATFRDQALVDLGTWRLRVDAETDQHAWKTTMQLADKHRLTLYDAVYLELALRRELPLATLDRALRAAAASEHVLLLGL